MSEENSHLKYLNLENSFRNFFKTFEDEKSIIKFSNHFHADLFEGKKGALYNAINYISDKCEEPIKNSLDKLLSDYEIDKNTLLKNDFQPATIYDIADKILSISQKCTNKLNI